jgi:hypothetical protein
MTQAGRATADSTQAEREALLAQLGRKVAALANSAA